MQPIETILESQRARFAGGTTREPAFRRRQLDLLQAAIRRNETAILEALHQDLGKSSYEAYITEVGLVLEEIAYLRANLRRLDRPRSVRTPMTLLPARSRVYREPYGVALILSPWNYPFQLAMTPLAGALAAGNCAVLKLSDDAPHTSEVIKRLLAACFPEDYVAVRTGGRVENRSLLAQRFDTIFFTGSVPVGRFVMEQAAKHLTPVTLELGGKSPCIVDETADLELAARRIVWGKFINAGQTCVAPDYLLVHESVRDRLTDLMRQCIRSFYGDQPHNNPQYPRIVSRRHFDRLLTLLGRGRIAHGGMSDADSLRIEPTLLANVTWDDPVMQEEIFAPILPVLTFRTLAEAEALIGSRPKPLALYLFTRSRANERHVIQHVSYGGGCVNDTLLHLANPHMPFGGVGESGMGGYHGEASYRTFSREKSMLHGGGRMDNPLRYPHHWHRFKLMKRLMR